MKNFGAILAVGITAVILITIGIFNFLLVPAAEPVAANENMPTAITEPTTIPDIAAIQAAYDARAALLQGQIAALDAEFTDRQGAYDLRVDELSGLIVASEQQVPQVADQENTLQMQIDQLYTAQTEREAGYESQRQQAYYQYQVNIQQLQTQLDESKAKLNEALGRLGQ